MAKATELLTDAPAVSLARITPVYANGEPVLTSNIGLNSKQIREILDPLKKHMTWAEYRRTVAYMKSLRNTHPDAHNLDISIRKNPKLLNALIGSALTSKVLSVSDDQTVYQTTNGKVVVTRENIDFYPDQMTLRNKKSLLKKMGLSDALIMVSPIMLDESMSAPVKHQLKSESDEKFTIMKAFSVLNREIFGWRQKDKYRKIENPNWVSYWLKQANTNPNEHDKAIKGFFGKAKSITRKFIRQVEAKQFIEDTPPLKKISWAGKPSRLPILTKALSSVAFIASPTAAQPPVSELPTRAFNSVKDDNSAEWVIAEALAATAQKEAPPAYKADEALAGFIADVEKSETKETIHSPSEEASRAIIEELSKLEDTETTLETDETNTAENLEQDESVSSVNIDAANLAIPQEDLTREKVIELIARYQNFIDSHEIAIEALREGSYLSPEQLNAKIDQYESRIYHYQSIIEEYKDGYLSLTEEEKAVTYQAIVNDIVTNPDKYRGQSIYAMNDVLNNYQYVSDDNRKEFLFNLQKDKIVFIAINDQQSEATFSRVASFKPQDEIYNTAAYHCIHEPEAYLGKTASDLESALRQSVEDSYRTPFLAKAIFAEMENQGLVELDENGRIKTVASQIASIPAMDKAFAEAKYITPAATETPVTVKEAQTSHKAEETIFVAEAEDEISSMQYSEDELARFAVEGRDPVKEARQRALALSASYGDAATPEQIAASAQEQAKWKPEDERRINEIISSGLDLRAA